VALLDSDFFCLGDPHRYEAVVNALRNWDHFMVCADYAAFCAAMSGAAELYRSQREWQRQAAFNIAGGSHFSSDATIRAYAKEIWDLKPVKVEVR
jgi:starch phosphorylase